MDYIRVDARELRTGDTIAPDFFASRILAPTDPTANCPEATPMERTPMEWVLEAVRQMRFPDRPSRLNSAFAFERSHGWEGIGEMHVYPVQPLGRVFVADMDLLSHRPWEMAPDEAIALAITYWTADKIPVIAEVLMEGGARVTGPCIL